MRFKETVMVEYRVGVDAYHKPKYSAPIEVKAVVDSAVKTMKDLPSNETTASAHILFPPEFGIGPDDRITTDDGTHPIRFISSAVNHRTHKVKYIEVYLGQQKAKEDRK